MDQEAEIGYLFPKSNVEQTNLEIKILTKKFVYLIFPFAVAILHIESSVHQ